MNNHAGARRWLWPALFLVLNLASILVWFTWYANGGGRELAITAVNPSGTEIDAEAVTEILLSFNLPLDPNTIRPDSLRLVPPIGGKTELTGPASLRFLPTEPLAQATAYTIIVSPTLRGSRGEPLPGDLLEFSTKRLRLESGTQVAYDNDSHTVELAFNQPIAASDLERALQTAIAPASGDSGSLVEVVGTDTSRTQRIRIRRTSPALLLFTLPAGLTGSAGPLGLDQTQKLLWHIPGTGDEPRRPEPEWAAGLEPIMLRREVAFHGMTAEWENGTGVVRVRSTVPIDVARAAPYITVDPDIPVTFSPAWNGLKIVGDFQPGKQYRVTLASGLSAGQAGTLRETVTRQVWFDDRPPSISIPYGGGFLSPHGMLTVPVRTCNMADFHVEIRKLYQSNLVEAVLREYDEELHEEHAEPEISRTVTTGGKRNQEQETLLNLRELVGDKPLGTYGLEVWNPEHRWRRRHALVAVTDLGLSCRLGRTTLVAWATSIREGTPRAGVHVSLYSNKRQLLASGTTGDDGTARLTLPTLARGEKPALLLGDAGDGECSFVRLERDTKPRPAATQRGPSYTGTYQVFLSAERGVYRGGETVLLAGLVRDAKVETVPDLPLDMVLLGPDGKRLRQTRVVADKSGRLAFKTELPAAIGGGIYAVEARLPGQEEQLGQALFRVADYLPESLSIAMNFADEKKDESDTAVRITVSRLAGGALDGASARVLVDFSPAPFTPEGWDGWAFGDSRRNGRAEGRERSMYLNSDGVGTATWSNPELPFPAAATMTVRCEAAEPGGRPVVGTLTKTVHEAAYYVGARLPGQRALAGAAFPIPLAAVRPDGMVEALDADWTGQLLRVEYTGTMKQNSAGRLVYEWIRQEIPEAKMSGIWKDGRSEARPLPLAGGAYRLVVESAGGRSCVVDFTVDGPGARWHGEDPENLTITLDRDDYDIGDRAVATTIAPFDGVAMIMVETDEVLHHWLMEFRRGENSFVVPVEETMRPNAYVSAAMVRPATAEEEWKPHRLSGTVLVKVNNNDRRLAVALDAPEHFVPGANARVTIKASVGDRPAANAAVVVWAVDVGVLSLTGYEGKSPWENLYQVRRAGVREADMYSRLAPELTGWLTAREASPGGGAMDEFARRLNPVSATRVKPMVVQVATLDTDDDGEVSTELPIPAFAGRMRLMCWAAAGNSMGYTEKEIEVKAPVSIAAGWPRFAAPGDRLDIPVTVVNRSGADGTALVVCMGDTQLEFEMKNMAVAVPDGQSRRVVLHARALKAGTASVAVSASLGEERFTDRVELSVRPPLLFAREAGVKTVEPGASATFTLADRLEAQNSKVRLLAGGSPDIGLAGCLESLLDYPYGCAEQTAARLLALTFLPDLLYLTRPDQLQSGEIGVLATACTERLSSMQTANGALRTWPRGGEELFWVSAQALFTLTESRAAGHAIPTKLIDNLSRYLNGRLDTVFADDSLDTDGGESVALALLALAKADALQRSWLIRLEEIADTRAKAGRPLSSIALAHLCNAIFIAGDRDAASKAFGKYGPSGSKTGLTGSRAVALSAWLMAALAVGDESSHEFAAELAELAGRGYTSWNTRENSMVLAALGRYWHGRQAEPEAVVSVDINGTAHAVSTRRGASWSTLRAGDTVSVTNPSSGALRLFWLAEGVPLSGKAVEEDRGLVARRELFDLQGAAIFQPYRLHHGEVYEVRLSIRGEAEDLVLVDLLPAGLEIEDASLKGRALPGSTAGSLVVKNVEVKDDRLLVFASLSGTGEYRYLVRAVTSGDFAWPAFDAGRMYDSSIRSVNGASRIKIVGGKEAANDR